MSMRRSAYWLFAFISSAIIVPLFVLLYRRTHWNPYWIWILAFSTASFVVYGLDKGLAIAQGPRAPEILLHALALLGGFPGAWLGMLLFRHKVNLGKHPGIWLVLVLSTLGHAALAYVWFLRGR